NALAQERRADVVDRDATRRPALELSLVCVPVEHSRHVVAVDRVLETARAEKWKDDRGLALDGRLDGRVVQEDHPLRRLQTSEPGLELEPLVPRLVNEALDRLPPPHAERVIPEASGEALHAGKPDAADLPALPIEDTHAAFREN